MHTKNIITRGEPLSKATRALVMIHGRGASAADILSLSNYLNVTGFALLAPEANDHTWYPFPFIAPPTQNEPALSSALQLLGNIVSDISAEGIHDEQIYFLGFSQGACLTLEFVTRNARRWGGVAAFTGGLIGDKIYMENYKGDFNLTPVFIGSSDPDPHIPVPRVKETVRVLKGMNAAVTEKLYPDMGHTVSMEEIEEVNRLLFK